MKLRFQSVQPRAENKPVPPEPPLLTVGSASMQVLRKLGGGAGGTVLLVRALNETFGQPAGAEFALKLAPNSQLLGKEYLIHTRAAELLPDSTPAVVPGSFRTNLQYNCGPGDQIYETEKICLVQDQEETDMETSIINDLRNTKSMYAMEYLRGFVTVQSCSFTKDLGAIIEKASEI